MPSSRPSFDDRAGGGSCARTSSSPRPRSVVSGSIVMTLSVIHWRTRASAARARCATARRRSRSVTIPTIRTMSSMTTTAPTPPSIIFSAASPIDAVGSTARTSRVHDLGDRCHAESLTEAASEERLAVDLAASARSRAGRATASDRSVLRVDEQRGDRVLGVAAAGARGAARPPARRSPCRAPRGRGSSRRSPRPARASRGRRRGRSRPSRRARRPPRRTRRDAGLSLRAEPLEELLVPPRDELLDVAGRGSAQRDDAVGRDHRRSRESRRSLRTRPPVWHVGQ